MKNKKNILLIITGAIVGLVNGFLGGGGGMIVVPLLTMLIGYKQKVAQSTAIMIILPVSIVSSVVYFISGSFDFKVGIPCVIGVLLGGLVGSFLLSKLSNKTLTKTFAVIMFIAGVKMLFF